MIDNIFLCKKPRKNQKQTFVSKGVGGLPLTDMLLNDVLRRALSAYPISQYIKFCNKRHTI